jgi:hypothetical protein
LLQRSTKLLFSSEMRASRVVFCDSRNVITARSRGTALRSAHILGSRQPCVMCIFVSGAEHFNPKPVVEKLMRLLQAVMAKMAAAKG